MKHTGLILLMAATAVAASAQTPAKPATTAPKTATTTTHSAAASTANKLPPGVPAVKGIEKTLFTVSLRYQDIKVGTGAEAEPNKMYKVFYTGWLASDGTKFDSTDDHPRAPVMDKDGKPVLGDDGKPKLGPPQPITFPLGFGRVIAGWDQGFEGMKIGGQRRIFIPWRLAYGIHGRPSGDPKHPGIPAKADLIFDVELVDVTDMPTPPNHPGMGGTPGQGGMPGMHMAPAGNPPPPGSVDHPAATPPQPGSPATPAAPASPATSTPTVAPPAPAATPAPAAPAQPQSK